MQPQNAPTHLEIEYACLSTTVYPRAKILVPLNDPQTFLTRLRTVARQASYSV